MKRNRSIRTLPLADFDLLRHPLPESPVPLDSEELCFGEEIINDAAPKNHLLSSDSDILLASVRNVGNSKSSSSSISWGEEFRNNASNKLRDELERMDKVLRGEEPIPEHYDKEEYEEWMEFFPNLCVIGTKVAHPKQAPKINGKIPRPEVDCDSIKINDQSVIDVDKFLKVTSLDVPKLPQRLSSSRSLISSQISSSKWLKDDEYTSLPFLSNVRPRKSASKSILKNPIVLPPIETTQFRSVSATPRRQNQTLSTFSDQKYSSFRRSLVKDLCK